MCAFATENWDIIGDLGKLLRGSSVLSRLRNGPTPAKEHGNEMADDIFPDLSRIAAVDEVLCDLARSDGVLCYSDDVMSVYRYMDGLYILPPVEASTVDNTSLRADHLQSVVDYMDAQDVPEDFGPSTLQDRIDLAVLEAGFATEPLRQCLQELYECLYVRMLNDPITGFSGKEWEACREAKRLLGLG